MLSPARRQTTAGRGNSARKREDGGGKAPNRPVRRHRWRFGPSRAPPLDLHEISGLADPRVTDPAWLRWSFGTVGEGRVWRFGGTQMTISGPKTPDWSRGKPDWTICPLDWGYTGPDWEGCRPDYRAVQWTRETGLSYLDSANHPPSGLFFLVPPRPVASLPRSRPPSGGRAGCSGGARATIHQLPGL